jgi:hypothetical protein
MGLWDAIITFALIAAAAIYLIRQFTRSGKSGSCGCSSEGGCCGNSASACGPCDGSRHH